jgi:hypothetical protein
MADLAATSVSFSPTDLRSAEFYPEGRLIVTRRLKLTSVSVGGATNRIIASALGFTKLVGCGSFFDSTNNKIIPAAVDPVNNIILLGAGSSLAVGDLSSVTGYITVWGY